MNPLGKVKPPPELNPFVVRGPEGAISFFLTNLVILIYIVAGIVFIFMILWAGFELIYSSGEKEALANARKRIVYALAGLVLLAISFALMSVIGTFLGWSLFK